MKELEKIVSVCPGCYQEGKIQKIDAQVIEDDGKIYITKTCDKHGPFKEIYFSDAALYKKWIKYKVTGCGAPDVKTKLFDYPELYRVHHSQSVLTNLLVTNRCNLRCSYCFMNAGASGVVYEPTLDQIKELMIQARNERPMGSKAIQITGGEPTVREDLFDIVRMAKEVGFTHVQVNTNGLKLADSADYCQRLKDEKVNTIYMSFDGVTKETNPWIEQSKKVIKNLRKVNLKVVLVPVLIGGKNLHETGKIVRFALDNMDIVRGVNFQPISFCGRVTKIKDEKRDQQRVDYVQMMAEIEKEFDGQISRDDFYPVPFVFPVSKLIELLKGKTQVEFTAHPGCGGATYIFYEDGKPLPVTRFIDVEGLLAFIEQQSQKSGPFKRLRIASIFLRKLNTFVDEEKAPQGFDLVKLVKDAAIGGSYDSLRGFHYKSLFVGSMWFQDAWNLNVDRLERCVIHYTTLEGIIPFCAYNGLGYGDKIREKHSLPIKEWEKKTGRKIKDDLRKDVPLT
ncbi:MAG: radical SAM protein [Candidatus Thermoplasmatota archaeon]|nr:radical SAM protein [Candidatus Thermoplasmatota archaeon]